MIFSRRATALFYEVMSEEQKDDVFARFCAISARFDDVRDALHEAITDVTLGILAELPPEQREELTAVLQ